MPTAIARPFDRFVQIPRTRMSGPILTRLRDAGRRLRLRCRQRRELMAMDEIGLRDLSLSLAEAEREAERPFWRALRIPVRGGGSPLSRRKRSRPAASD